MICTEEQIWKPCSRLEYEIGRRLGKSYRKVPVYNTPPGIVEQIKFVGKEPDDWRYEKSVGTKMVWILNSAEAKDKKLREILSKIANKEDNR